MGIHISCRVAGFTYRRATGTARQRYLVDDRMSGSKGESDQCNRMRESNVVAMMGDVLVEKNTRCGVRVHAEDEFTQQENERTVNCTEDAVGSPVVADFVPAAVCFPTSEHRFAFTLHQRSSIANRRSTCRVWQWTKAWSSSL